MSFGLAVQSPAINSIILYSESVRKERRPCLKGRVPNETAHSSFSKKHSPPPNPKMHGAVSFGIAAVLGGGRCGQRSSEIGAYLVGTQYSARGACASLFARKEFEHGI